MILVAIIIWVVLIGGGKLAARCQSKQLKDLAQQHSVADLTASRTRGLIGKASWFLNDWQKNQKERSGKELLK